MPPPRSILDTLRERRLAKAYVAAVRHRSPKSRVPEPPVSLVREISDGLRDPRLVDLFMESQFDAMPAAWCQQMFKRPYPPANVVFGGECWRRYEEYIEKGERRPIQEAQ